MYHQEFIVIIFPGIFHDSIGSVTALRRCLKANIFPAVNKEQLPVIVFPLITGWCSFFIGQRRHSGPWRTLKPAIPSRHGSPYCCHNLISILFIFVKYITDPAAKHLCILFIQSTELWLWFVLTTRDTSLHIFSERKTNIWTLNE